jgi:hypothetical protein
VLAAAAVLAGCGGSSHHASSASSQGASGGGAAGAGGGATARGGSRAGGGAEPVRAPAALTGRGGKVTPSSVHVPPFIAIQVTLTSADGRSYTLQAGRRTLTVGHSSRTASLYLPGLRPGLQYALGAHGGGTIHISATAEPGP